MQIENSKLKKRSSFCLSVLLMNALEIVPDNVGTRVGNILRVRYQGRILLQEILLSRDVNNEG